MPVFAHGKNAKFYVNGWDLSAYFTKVGAAAKADTAEVSTLGTTDKQYLNGLKDGTLTGDGFFSGNPNTADSVLGSAFLVDTPSSILSLLPQGDSFGGKAVGMDTCFTDFSVDTDTGNAGAISVAAQSHQGLNSGVVLHKLQSESAGGTGAQVDNGAASNAGLDSYLQVVLSSGGNLNVKVQHSSDNVTYTDLCVHTLVNASHKAERVSSLVAVSSGLVNRYIRTLWTLTGTATFHVSASRLALPH